MPPNRVRLTTNNRKQWVFFINITAMCWTHKIASCHQPCHGGFTAKITSSPNTICMVNHATEDLQHRILDFSKYHSLHCHKKIERAREKRRLRWWSEQYTEWEERETQEQWQYRLTRQSTAHVMVCYKLYNPQWITD